MPPDLRAKLQNEADLVGRSLNSEILARLAESFNKKQKQVTQIALDSNDASYNGLTDTERSMLTLFKRWSPEKQLSFLVLFK